MKMKINLSTLIAMASLVGASMVSTSACAQDDAAAESMVRQNGCLKCHSVTKHKEGPAYHDVAEKYRGKPGAEERIIKHITSGEKAKFDDGHEEEHKIIKTKDPAELKNVADWILSR